VIVNANSGLSVIFLVTTGAMLPFIDRLPRRMLLLTGSIVCCICHFTVAGLMASYGHHVDSINGNSILRWKVDNNTAAKGIIAVSYIFVGFYGLTWAPCGWIVSSEVFPLKYRAQGVGLSAATNWICNFAIAYFGTYSGYKYHESKATRWRFETLNFTYRTSEYCYQ
jgi:MFS family permease